MMIMIYGKTFVTNYFAKVRLQANEPLTMNDPTALTHKRERSMLRKYFGIFDLIEINHEPRVFVPANDRR